MNQVMRYFIIIIILFIWGQAPLFVQAAEDETTTTDYYDELDFSQMQEIVEQATDNNSTFDFGTYVKKLIDGEESFSVSSLLDNIKSTVFGEWERSKKTLLQLLTIAIIAGVFSNFTHVFKNSQVAETGFYITYLLLFSVLMTSFIFASSVATKTLGVLFDFMRALVPVYFLTMTFSNGMGTSSVFYQSTLGIIALAEVLLLKIIFPLIQMYFVIILANNLSKEDKLSKLADLIETIVSWALKSLVGAVIGFQVIQGLIVPVANQFKNSTVIKTASAIPMVGNALGSVTETVIAAGILIKNAVGVAGLLAIILLCAVPLTKLLLYVLIYKFGVTLVQPISDKRILNCMNGASKAAELLLYTEFIGAILFLLTIVVITASTGRI